MAPVWRLTGLAAALTLLLSGLLLLGCSGWLLSVHTSCLHVVRVLLHVLAIVGRIGRRRIVAHGCLCLLRCRTTLLLLLLLVLKINDQ